MTQTQKELRHHQIEAIGQMRRAVARAMGQGKGGRVMLKLPTGAGKTVIAANIVKSARAKGHRVLFIVDALSLIDQTVLAFHAEGVGEIGVIQADHPMTDYSKPVQIASIATLRKRGMTDAMVIIVDEAHCQDRWLIEQMASEAFADRTFIGLSATPWSRGLGNAYEDLIAPITMQQLIDAGFLSPFRVFAASHPDLTDVKTIAGDYHEGQLAEVMANGQLMADIVDTWQRRGDNRPTFAFCVDRAHAKALQQRFEAAGIGCGYIDAWTKSPEREQVHRDLDAGRIRVVCNVGCLTKGVDWAIGCVILARPTRSEMLYVQMVGRGLRVNPGMDDCVILDHADNTLRMGFVTDVDAKPRTMSTAVKGEREKPERPVALPKECPSCSFLKPPKVAQCPGCGFKPERQSKVAEIDAELVEVKPKKLKATMADKARWFAELNGYAFERGYKPGWGANAYRKKFGAWPNSFDRNMCQPPSGEIIRYARSLAIRYAKGQRA